MPSNRKKKAHKACRKEDILAEEINRMQKDIRALERE
jgi:hypothetical protein